MSDRDRILPELTTDAAPPQLVTINGGRGGGWLGSPPRTRITIHRDFGGPALVSGRRLRRAKERAETRQRQGGGRRR